MAAGGSSTRRMAGGVGGMGGSSASLGVVVGETCQQVGELAAFGR